MRQTEGCPLGIAVGRLTRHEGMDHPQWCLIVTVSVSTKRYTLLEPGGTLCDHDAPTGIVDVLCERHP